MSFADTSSMLAPTSWLEEARQQVASTEQFEELSRVVHACLQAEVRRAGVQYFSQLAEEEKVVFVDSVERQLQGTALHAQLVQHTSKVLDDKLRSQGSKREEVMNSAASGIAELLHKWPDQQRKLVGLANQPLRGQLRVQAWHRRLDSPAVDKEYTQWMFASTKAWGGYAHDMEVTQACQNVLNSTASEGLIDPENIDGALVATMKTMVQFWLAHPDTSDMVGLQDRLDTDSFPVYRLCLPLLAVMGDSGRKEAQLAAYLVSLSVMQRVRVYPLATGEEQHQSNARFTNALVAALHKVDDTLHYHLMVLANESVSSSKSSSGGSPELRLSMMVWPAVSSLFVGVLDATTLLYVWDQFMLCGIDRMIVPITLSVVLCLREQLLLCDSMASATSTLRTEAPAITVKQIQDVMETHFMSSVRQVLNTTHKTKEELSTVSKPTPQIQTVDDEDTHAHLDESSDEDEPVTFAQSAREEEEEEGVDSKESEADEEEDEDPVSAYMKMRATQEAVHAGVTLAHGGAEHRRLRDLQETGGSEDRGTIPEEQGKGRDEVVDEHIQEERDEDEEDKDEEEQEPIADTDGAADAEDEAAQDEEPEIVEVEEEDDENEEVHAWPEQGENEGEGAAADTENDTGGVSGVHGDVDGVDVDEDEGVGEEEEENEEENEEERKAKPLTPLDASVTLERDDVLLGDLIYAMEFMRWLAYGTEKEEAELVQENAAWQENMLAAYKRVLPKKQAKNLYSVEQVSLETAKAKHKKVTKKFRQLAPDY